jgi:hypothetical protein
LPAVSTLSIPGHFTVVVAALPAATCACFEIANVIRSASGASFSGAPVTVGVGQGFDGVGSAVSVGVDAVGIGWVEGAPELGADGDGEVPASGLLSEQDDSTNNASADNPKTAGDSLIVSNPPGAGRDSR